MQIAKKTAILAIAVSLAPPAKSKISTDFLKGFEMGITVRDEMNAFDDYSCDKPQRDPEIDKQS